MSEREYVCVLTEADKPNTIKGTESEPVWVVACLGMTMIDERGVECDDLDVE